MKTDKLSKKTLLKIDKLVDFYDSIEEKEGLFNIFVGILSKSLLKYPPLKPYIHSIKYRVKDSEHLRKKLIRKAINEKKEKKDFSIKKENFFEEIEDLAGVRILHLYTKQMEHINKILKEFFNTHNYTIVKGPIANTWDDEYTKFFKSLSMEILPNSDMYTSVHYVICMNNKSQTKCELQVRTLMEEVWGEVSHAINYPDETAYLCCKEQIKVLARATSSCTRLVDSIFTSHEDHIASSAYLKNKD